MRAVGLFTAAVRAGVTVEALDTVEVDGLTLAYRRTGNGQPVIFVHGGAEYSRAWTPQLDALSDEFAWDEPGAGGSDDVPEEFSLSAYADCLAGMIGALGLSPVSVVALSWGTTVILELYRRHSVVVRSMVLADGYAGWRGSLGAQEADARLAGVRAAFGRAGRAGTAQFNCGVPPSSSSAVATTPASFRTASWRGRRCCLAGRKPC